MTKVRREALLMIEHKGVQPAVGFGAREGPRNLVGCVIGWWVTVVPVGFGSPYLVDSVPRTSAVDHSYFVET